MTRKIELCSNDEWLTLYGPLSDLPGGNADDKAVSCKDWWSRACNAIESRFGGVEVKVVRPQGQRIFCHGWNGANVFERKTGALLTFAEFTDSEWDEVCAIAQREAEKVVADALSHVQLCDVETGHVWFSGIGQPAGCALQAEEGEPLAFPQEGWAFLTGRIEGNKWLWDGEGDPRDWKGNAVQKIVAFVR